MKLVFFGTSSFGLDCLDFILQSGHTLLSVVTFPDKPTGRKLALKPSSVKVWARTNSIPVIEFTSERESAVFSDLEKLNAELFIVVSFGKILDRRYLALPKIACLNIHASLLPKFRGASPMQQALLEGDSFTGVSVMRMVEALDAGDVLLSKKIPLTAGENITTLEDKLRKLAAQSLKEAFLLIQDKKMNWSPQDAANATYCSKIKKSDGRVDWNLSAHQLDCRIRAFLSWPGSFTFFKQKRIIIKKACPAPDKAFAAVPGKVIKIDPKGILVACGQGALLLEQLQLEGRSSLKADIFLNGFSLKVGDILE